MTENDTIRYAELDGVYLIKFEGDIRVTLSASFDDFINSIFANPRLAAILLDLRDAKNIDSTSLGMIAKIAARSQAELHTLPSVISNQDDINRTLECMGLLTVLNVVGSDKELGENLQEHIKEMPLCNHSPEEMCEKVLEAHKILMDLNKSNQDLFKDLVSGLEEERSQHDKNMLRH